MPSREIKMLVQIDGMPIPEEKCPHCGKPVHGKTFVVQVTIDHGEHIAAAVQYLRSKKGATCPHCRRCYFPVRKFRSHEQARRESIIIAADMSQGRLKKGVRFA